ncbi:MAG TPA: DUF192 domain-containing protein [Burkholderiales bacterium]|nr:DUF192 domain-containing protein [Burkholderiales bacterium]
MTIQQRAAWLILLAAAALNVAAASSKITLSAGMHLIQAEVMNTQQGRMKGLMNRKSMGANEGMLFSFPEAERHCMWMKNTDLPLSVAFIDEQGIVVNIEDMTPHTENPHCAAKAVPYALEMHQGWFAARGIKPGFAITGIEQAPMPR